MQPDITLTKKDCPTTPAIQKETDAKYSNIHFRSVIGALIYLSSGTRPDVTFATVKLARYAHVPGENRYKALIWLVGYIHKFANKAIHFYSEHNSSPIGKILHQANINLNDKTTVTFIDSSWQDYVDTGRSMGGYIIFKSGGAVNHSCHLPIPVALSSDKAEYLAASVACTATQHIRIMNYDLYQLSDKDYTPENTENYPASGVILDSEAAIAIASLDNDTKRTRHILQRNHFVQQGSALGQHQLGWISTENQMADHLT